MALDTASKRASALGVALVSTLLIIPDGTLGQGDRQTIGQSYSGVMAVNPIETPDSFYASSGLINANVLASVGIIIPEGIGSASVITDSFSSSGKIDDNVIASTGIIDPEGSASKGDI